MSLFISSSLRRESFAQGISPAGVLTETSELLIASDNPTDGELTELTTFWMWEPVEEKWDYIRNWEEHKRKAIEKHARMWRTALVNAEEKSGSPTRWIQ